MKKLLPLLLFILGYGSKAQVVFCPPGAEWHYSTEFTWGGLPPEYTTFYHEIRNMKVRYTGDTLIGSDTVRIIMHPKFYTGSCEHRVYHPTSHHFKTLIRQRGDTIFFRNSFTNYQWQILYNFAATAGDSWQNTFNTGPNYSYTVSVDSTAMVTVNNVNLKRLYVRQSTALNIAIPPSTITERLGSSGFLFHFVTQSCGGDDYYGNLCYQDSTFGIKQFSEKSCNYTATFTLTTGLTEHHKAGALRLYPNPAGSSVYLDADPLPAGSSWQIQVSDLSGRILISSSAEFNTGTKEINIESLSPGVYFMTLSDNENRIATAKFIKE